MNPNGPIKTPSRLLTRSDVARRLRVTKTTVRRFEGTLLHPQIDDEGQRFFDAGEVERVAHSRSAKPAPAASGEIAGEAFRLFRQGYDLDEIVMRLNQPPSTIRSLFNEWCRGL